MEGALLFFTDKLRATLRSESTLPFNFQPLDPEVWRFKTNSKKKSPKSNAGNRKVYEKGEGTPSAELCMAAVFSLMKQRSSDSVYVTQPERRGGHPLENGWHFWILTSSAGRKEQNCFKLAQKLWARREFLCKRFKKSRASNLMKFGGKRVKTPQDYVKNEPDKWENRWSEDVCLVRKKVLE